MQAPTEYINLTKLALETGIQLNNWIGRPVGKKAIAKFAESHPEVAHPVVVIRGRSRNAGTWAHPELAAIFAAWCDSAFTGAVVAQNASLQEENARLRATMNALRSKWDAKSPYYLERQEDKLDTRFQYLIDAGYTLEELGEMIPVPTKQCYKGWSSVGERAKEISQLFGIPFRQYDNIDRAIWGRNRYVRNKAGNYEVIVKSVFGDMPIHEIGINVAPHGYALCVWP